MAIANAIIRAMTSSYRDTPVASTASTIPRPSSPRAVRRGTRPNGKEDCERKESAVFGVARDRVGVNRWRQQDHELRGHGLNRGAECGSGLGATSRRARKNTPPQADRA